MRVEKLLNDLQLDASIGQKIGPICQKKLSLCGLFWAQGGLEDKVGGPETRLNKNKQDRT